MKKEKRISILSKRNEELEYKIIQLSNELEKDKNLKEEYRNKMAILLNNFESLRLDLSKLHNIKPLSLRFKPSYSKSYAFI